MSTIRKFAGQTIIYGASTIISRLLNFILTPVFTRVYDPKVYGVFTYMYSWASMLNAVLAFGMETTFFRYLHKHEGDKSKVYNNTFVTIIITCLLFLLFTVFFVDDISAWMQKGKVINPDYSLYVKYFIYILIVDALAVIPFAKIRADGRPLRYGLIKFVNILTFVGFNFLFIFGIPYLIKTHGFGSDFLLTWFKPKWVGYVFISNLIASIGTLVLLLPELLQFRLKFEPRIIKEMMIYSLPVLVANISFIINENVDKIFLGMLLPHNISETEVGIYGACAKLAIFLSIFVQAFRLGAEPFFFSHAKSKNSGETYSRIMTWFVIIVSLIFVGISANIEILKYFIGPGFWSGLKIVPVLLLGYVSLGIYMNLSIWYKLSDQTRFGLYISLIAAVLTVILNLIFIPKYSYVASAWISLTAYATMMILSYYLGQKNYPIPYKIKKNLAYLLISTVLVYVSFSIFKRDLIIGNVLLVLFVTGTLYAERKELKLLVRSS